MRSVRMHGPDCTRGNSKLSLRSYGGTLVIGSAFSMKSSNVYLGDKGSRSKHHHTHPYRGIMMSNYAMFGKRNNFIMNDRVDNKMHGISIDGYRFLKASIKLHFGDGQKHKKIIRGV